MKRNSYKDDNNFQNKWLSNYKFQKYLISIYSEQWTKYNALYKRFLKRKKNNNRCKCKKSKKYKVKIQLYNKKA